MVRRPPRSTRTATLFPYTTLFRASLPLRSDAAYRLGGATSPVNAAFGGDLRLAYVSCNGQESGDRKRPLEARNVLWQRLNGQHDEAPFHLQIGRAHV